MRARIVVGLIVSAVTMASCGGRQPVEINPAQSITVRWNGTVSAPPELAGVSDVRGQAWMASDPRNADQTRAHAQISNAVPGSVHPWHVHRGQCGTDQGILGPADAYRPLHVEGNGRAVSDAQLPLPLPRTGDFFVNVHASARNMKTIVACGNLAPPAR